MTAPRPRILVAEDHPEVARGLLELLEADFEIAGHVESGLDVVAAVARTSPDLLLLDLWLPGRNGLDMVPELREAHPAMRILILTGHTDVVVAVQAMNQGADGFIGKNSGYAELKSAIAEVLAGRGYLSPKLMVSPPTPHR
ncbi:MAG TPA: response regulator [Gemmatimonadales bacterium]|jgi:DNA-binding NarL/FixJ family response regulator|nr:response regulator [Gemmatimonadales bacterium]